MREQPGHNLARMGPADYITLVRLVLVALMASTLTRDSTAALQWTLIALTTVIGVMDGVDGWVARRTGTASAFGARFDMETDALLILVLSVLVWQHDKAGAWVLPRRVGVSGFAIHGRIHPAATNP
jgi:phosphatidylglycerophosphate synthase